MASGRTLQLLEILLKRHQAFYPEVELYSMQDAVAKVIAEVEEGIQAWIEAPARPRPSPKTTRKF